MLPFFQIINENGKMESKLLDLDAFQLALVVSR